MTPSLAIEELPRVAVFAHGGAFCFTVAFEGLEHRGR